VSRLLDGIGRIIARYLQKPVHGYEPFTPSDPEALRQSLEPGDVLLVEGNNNISGVIKYLTQSTWSHSALFVVLSSAASPRTASRTCWSRPMSVRAWYRRRSPNMSAFIHGSAGRSV
jgi:hypothetical protein